MLKKVFVWWLVFLVYGVEVLFLCDVFCVSYTGHHASDTLSFVVVFIAEAVYLLSTLILNKHWENKKNENKQA